MYEFNERRNVAAAYLTLIELSNYSNSKIKRLLTEHGLELITGGRVENLTSITIMPREFILKIFESSLRIMNNVRSDIKNNCYLITAEDNLYPPFLKELHDFPPVLFAIGNLDYLFRPSFAIVGTRNPSNEGIKRAKKIADLLTKNGFVIVSGLAKGIDSAAHESAILNYGKTIAVIGTPLDKYYPKENKSLQDFIAKEHLLISQFPFGYKTKKYSFTDRNYTMMGLSLATIVVEARKETSGAMSQARMALKQNRKVFLLENLFNQNMSWPDNYLKKGAKRIKSIEDIINEINVVLEDFRRKNKQFDLQFNTTISNLRLKLNNVLGS